jgi:ABC-type multidrug transport system fused ATPase/permease subunit
VKEYWRFLRLYVAHHKSDIAAGVGLAFLQSLLSLASPTLTKVMVDYVLVRGGEVYINKMLLFIIAVLIGTTLLYVSYNAILIRGFYRIGLEVKTSLFDRLSALDVSTLSAMPSGFINYRLFGDTEVLQSSLGRLILNLVLNVVMIACFSAYMVYLNLRLAAFVIVVLSLQVFVIRHFRRPLLECANERKSRTELLNARVVEVFGAFHLVRASGAEGREKGRFRGELGRVVRVAVRESLLTITSGAWIGVINGLVTFGVLWFGGLQVIHGQLTLGSLLAFMLVGNMLSTPVAVLTSAALEFQNIRTSARRFFETFDLKTRVESVPGAPNPALSGQIAFERVTFGYAPGLPVLRDVSFEVPPRTIASVVGRSGMGKTTLCFLLARLYDPADGAVRVDGHDLRGLDLEGYRRQVGLVLQNSFLLSGTVRENIALGDARAADDDIVRAAMMANAHEFISRMPKGYDSEVGERGVRLSGGEAQRIALARVFLQDPRLVILDEATSFVDLESEERIQEAIRRLAERSTVVIITHKLATAKLASRILVLDDGTVAEQGSHDELVARGGVYTRLYRQVLA